MDTTKHISEITIKNSSKEIELSLEELKRINLITGKNNVGKTMLLEAIYLNANSDDIIRAVTVLQKIGVARIDAGTVEISSGLNFVSYESYDKYDDVYLGNIHVSDKTTVVPPVNFRIDPNTVNKLSEKNFSGVLKPNVKLLREGSLSLDDVSLEDSVLLINDLIKGYDDNIKKYVLLKGKPYFETNEGVVSLKAMGVGLRRLIDIIVGIYSCKNGIFLIDNLEIGFHYEYYERLWEIILTISLERNCQVFITTQSKEIITAYSANVEGGFKNLGEEDFSFTLLVKNKNGKLTKIFFDYEMYQYSMSQEHEMRQ